MSERLQKLLAGAGIASRRAAEQLILAGRVTVNGRLVRELGVRADPERDDIRLDGRPVQRPATHTYLMMHKPAGFTSTAADPHASRTVMHLLPKGTPRVYPVGRLDRDSEGLLLFTDDGALAQRLTHPRYHLPREYGVLVRGEVDGRVLQRLRAGVVIDGRRAVPVEVDPAEPPPGFGSGPAEPDAPVARRARALQADVPELWLRFVLHEGRKRQIRITCEQAGLEVQRLVRISMGPVSLGSLAAGLVRPLRKPELAALRRVTGLPDPPAGEGERPPAARRPVLPAAAPARRRPTHQPPPPATAGRTTARRGPAQGAGTTPSQTQIERGRVPSRSSAGRQRTASSPPAAARPASRRRARGKGT